MRDLQLSKSSGSLDVLIENGDQFIIEGIDAIRQAVEFKLEFFQNDWMLDLGFGIPYYGRVFQRGVNINDLYGFFSFAIEEEPGIEYVKDLNINIDKSARSIRVTGSAMTSEGELIEMNSSPGV